MFTFLKDKLKVRVFATAGIFYNSFGVPYSLGKYLQSERDVVLLDIGAHTGTFTLAVDRMCTVKRGLMVEPQPYHARNLRRAFAEPRFTVVEAALSNWRGRSDLNIRNFDATTSLLPIYEEAEELKGTDVGSREIVECAVRTLSDVVQEAAVPNVDLIKLDVQGAELAVLLGGPEVVRSARMIWVEVSFKPLYEKSCLFHEIYDFMHDNGHKLMELESGYRAQSGELIQADALFMRR